MSETICVKASGRQSVLIMAMFSAAIVLPAWANGAPSDPKPADDPTVNARTRGSAKRKPDVGENSPKKRKASRSQPKPSEIKVKRATTAKARSGKAVQARNAKRKGGRKTPLTMDPNAKWSCEKSEFDLGPIWRSNKALNFTFFIKNEGTADLEIRAKGG